MNSVTPAPSPGEPVDACCPDETLTLLPAPEAVHLAEVFKALADPTRVRLLRYLAESRSGTACACHLPQALGISQPTLSFHMGKLHAAGLVDRDKRGRWVHWTVRPAALKAARAFLDLPGNGACAPARPDPECPATQTGRITDEP